MLSSLGSGSSAKEIDSVGESLLGKQRYAGLRSQFDLRKTGAKAALIAEIRTLAGAEIGRAPISTPAACRQPPQDSVHISQSLQTPPRQASLSAAALSARKTPLRQAEVVRGPAVEAEQDREEESDGYGSGDDWMEIGESNATGTVDVHRRIQIEAERAGLKTPLKEFQKEGLVWLLGQEDTEKCGLLADDMGLGKTIQMLTLIAIQKARGKNFGPTLVVAQLSVLENWRKNLEDHFVAHTLQMHVNHDKTRMRSAEEFLRFDVIVTNWHTLRSSEYGAKGDGPMKQVRWGRIVLDDCTAANGIKNPTTISHKLCLTLDAASRWCLTGTPVENSLGDFLSILKFLRLQPFCRDDWFRRNYERGDEASRRECNRRTFLRRTKLGVSGTEKLPRRFNYRFDVVLSEEEREFHDLVMSSGTVRDFEWKIPLTKILRSRQVATYSKYATVERLLVEILGRKFESGEFDEVRKDGVHAVGRNIRIADFTADSFPPKICIFSQWNAPLGLIEELLREKGIGTIKIIQGVGDREELIRQFTERPDIRVALCGTRAGGTGINLQAANVVILLDNDWNPAVERQATDRCWRIGSPHTGVFVFEFLAHETEELRVEKKKQHKTSLFDQSIKISEDGAGYSH